ncbi:MAG: L-threonylcarbamoyladenylate synthase [Thermodesulfobacteriota bacterium]|nr:L-threonylcarbamoyladenylate synthase [Thermodesulfobacteriota bacterium]
MLMRMNPQNPQPRLIGKAVEILKDGGVIAYPTDTVYGLGCSLYNKKGIERIYQIKRSEKNRPFSFICADLKSISLYGKVSNYAYKMMRRFLPGPYTFILEGTKLVPKIMLTRRMTAGIRVPNNPICLAIVKELGHPIISTSAVLPAGEVLYDPAEIEKKLGHALDLVIDGGILVSEPSSVLDLTDDMPKVLRKGKGDVSLFL